MTLKSFQDSLKDVNPPSKLNGPLTALWYVARGDWKKAHQTVQDDEGPEAAWVHAHLHRKEGDLSNARYWYSRSGQDSSGLPLEEEWSRIAEALLTRR